MLPQRDTLGVTSSEATPPETEGKPSAMERGREGVTLAPVCRGSSGTMKKRKVHIQSGDVCLSVCLSSTTRFTRCTRTTQTLLHLFFVLFCFLNGRRDGGRARCGLHASETFYSLQDSDQTGGAAAVQKQTEGSGPNQADTQGNAHSPPRH